MHRSLFLLIVAGVSLLMALLLVLHLHSGAVDNQTVDNHDPVLAALRTSNPGLVFSKRLQDDFDRIPVFWVADPASGARAMLARSLAEGVTTVAFAPCVGADIPARLFYPGASAPVCLTIKNGDSTLHAMYFSAPGRMTEMVNHYDGPPTNGARRQGKWVEQSRREGRLVDGSIGFLHAYYLYETVEQGHWRMLALVGYRRERR